MELDLGNPILYIKVTMSICVGSHCPFPQIMIGQSKIGSSSYILGVGTGEAGEAAGRGGEGTSGGELDGCIMHQVHTSILKLQCLSIYLLLPSFIYCLSVYYYFLLFTIFLKLSFFT